MGAVTVGAQCPRRPLPLPALSTPTLPALGDTGEHRATLGNTGEPRRTLGKCRLAIASTHSTRLCHRDRSDQQQRLHQQCPDRFRDRQPGGPLPKQWTPADVESDLYQGWVDAGYFHADATSDRKPFSIVLPPPNVTGQLHMGHALDHTLMDAMARRKRMQGYEVLWLPGSDHAGIATQTKVEGQPQGDRGQGPLRLRS
jgi:hypothetical protein